MRKRILLYVVTMMMTAFAACVPLTDTRFRPFYAYTGNSMPELGNKHAEMPFSEMSFASPDCDAMLSRANELYLAIQSRPSRSDRKDLRSLQNRLETLQCELQEAESACAYAYILYCRDITDSDAWNRYAAMNAQLDPIYAKLTDCAVLLSEEKALKSVYDPQMIRTLRETQTLYDPAVQPLFRREQELVQKYDQLRETITILHDGKQWNETDLMEDQTMPFAQWYALYREYENRLSEEAGSLFLELIQVRKQIAKVLGFASYPAYRYTVYGRDYSTEDAEGLSRSVANHLAKVYVRAFTETATDREILYMEDTYSAEKTFHTIGTIVPNILSENEKPWSYMIRNGLFETGSGTHRMQGSFTTYIAKYQAPYLFLTWDGSAAMPDLVLHEFGHFAGYYHRAERGDASGGSLDLAEADSQTMELLAMPYYGAVYGNRADEARSVRMADTLFAILAGCAVDAFERYAYTADRVSVEDLNACFTKLCSFFALDQCGYTGTTWTEIDHIFHTPLYYLSYAVGGITAARIYMLSLHHPELAKRIYQRILQRTAGARTVETLQNCGLTEPLSDDTIQKLSILFENGKDSELHEKSALSDSGVFVVPYMSSIVSRSRRIRADGL